MKIEKLNSVKLLILFLLSITLYTCSNDDSDSNDNTNDPDSQSCSDAQTFLYEEKDGLIVVEFESIRNVNNWSVERSINGFLGTDYLLWKGDSYNNNPGNGLLTYKLKITNPGTYRFLWRSRVAKGTSSSEHNDSWLRFADASSFYGRKGESIVYPRDTGQTPNPNGSSKDGWFKIYKSGDVDQWKWQSSTSDNDAHNIFVEFDTPGIYTMEVSARSDHHAIDRFVMFTETVSQNEATDENTELSVISCN